MKIISLIAGVAFSTGVVASEVVFAPNVQPCPVEIKVESNTMVRLDRSLTVTIACAAGNEAAVESEHCRRRT